MGKNSKKQQHDRVVTLTFRVNHKHIKRLMIVLLICSSLVSDQAQLSKKPPLGQKKEQSELCTEQ
ncbi:MAG TPA: hypothetical protein DD408_11330 [Rheinheimera sp.]|jgi:hypothetical protein|nr:hypothetical protein [Rheinheimera sp.]|tara:strand:+ start:37 stop:231 length:195 start_codon:yes stop_codon:yes gene_type:complete